VFVAIARVLLVAAALASGAAAAQSKPKIPTALDQTRKPAASVPQKTADYEQIYRAADKIQSAQVEQPRGRYTGAMDCRGGGMDVDLKVIRMNGVEQYGMEMIFRGDTRQARGVCTISGDYRPQGLLDGKARLSFFFPLAQLRELEISDGRVQRIRTDPTAAGQFINAALNDGWFRVRVREVQDAGTLPLYLVDEIVERRL
jgi:hypothetical protein